VIFTGFRSFLIKPAGLLHIAFRPDGELLFFQQQKKSNQKNAAAADCALAPIKAMGARVPVVLLVSPGQRA